MIGKSAKTPRLIVGGDSMLGSALADHWSAEGRTVYKTSRRDNPAPGVLPFDLATQHDPASELEETGAAAFCACNANLKDCRDNPESTRRVNVAQTVKTLDRLVERGWRAIWFSTNLVFDGAKPNAAADSPHNPKTEYGRQKSEVEQTIVNRRADVAIVRLSKALHPKLALLANWRDSLAAGRPIRAFTDYFCSPISLEATVRVVAAIADSGGAGVWQLSAERDVAYAEIAERLAERMGADPALVELGSAQGVVEHLPKHATFDSSRISQELGIQLESADAVIDDAIEECLRL